MYDFNLPVRDSASYLIVPPQAYLMDPKRVPPGSQPQFETSPIHSLDKDTSGGIQPDPFNPSLPNVLRPTARINTSNLIPYASAGNASMSTEPQSPEKLEVSEILLSLSNTSNDYFAQSIHSPLPVRLPESKRETEKSNERFSNTMAQIHSGVDWSITGEGVSKHLSTLNLFEY